MGLPLSGVVNMAVTALAAVITADVGAGALALAFALAFEPVLAAAFAKLGRLSLTEVSAAGCA